MPEQDLIAAQDRPRTRDGLAADLRSLGLPAGATLLVHSSLSSLGWVAGGAVAAALALLDAVGPDGTLVVATQTGHLSDPEGWSRPPVPPSWWQPIRDNVPAYDPARTPPRGMGAVVEVVRHLPGAVRSSHPLLSFAAVGPAAEHLMNPHPLAPGLGDGSPLSRLADTGAHTLLLGVGWDSATCLHLAEARAGVRPTVDVGAPVTVAGARRWLTWRDLDWDAEDFPTLGAALEASGRVVTGRVGSATAKLVGVADAVTFGTDWFGGAPRA